MISNPLFSIIVCTYNRKSLISKCINSILNQTINDFELIIVDDCSSDGTFDFLLTYNDSRIRLFKTEFQSGGASDPRNLGVINSKGKYLAFCDSDDFYNNNHLEN